MSYSPKFAPILFIFVWLNPYAFIHAKSSSFLAAHVTIADSPTSFLAKTFPILPNPNINTLLPCNILFVFNIASLIVPSAVAIVFNTASSSLFIKSTISTYSSFAILYTSGGMFPAIKIFAFITCINSLKCICSLLNGVLISFPLLVNGTGPIIMSLLFIASFSVLACTIDTFSFNSWDSSSPKQVTLFPSSSSILASFINLKSPPTIAKFFFI